MNKPTFKHICLMHIQQLTNFPYIEKDFDALTDYGLLCKVVDYLNQVITNENTQNENIVALYNAFVELKDFVDNYFDNLDVQDEINNKLDEMLEDGVLEQIIEQYIQSSALWCFDNVAEMKQATNLINGSYAKTLGYYSKNDGGESIYKIRSKTNEDIPDERLIISLYNNLVAEISAYDTINIKQLGAYGDGNHDDTNAFKTFANSNITQLIIPNGTYNLTDILDFTNKDIKGIGQPSLNYVSQTTPSEHFIKLHQRFNIENITFNQLVNNTDVIGVFDCSYSTFKNCKFIADGYKCGSELDLYTNNHDILIDNCYFKLKSYYNNEYQEGGIWVREHISDKETYNILFNNCVIEHESIDEIIASWNWVGSVHDVILNNCKLIGGLNNSAPWFITFNTENSQMNNCYIENKTTTAFSGLFKSNENIDYKDISINNCIIKSHANILNALATFIITFNDCNIYNGTTTGNFRIDFKSKLNNCVVNAIKLQFNGANAYNCKFNGDGSDLNYNFITMNNATKLQLENCEFNNYKFTGGMFIYTFNNCDYIIIKNCIFNIDISGMTYWLFGANDITKLIVENSNIEKGIYTTGSVGGYIVNNITYRTISAFSNVKVNNNFNITE